MNLIEEKVGSSLQCKGTGDHFLNITPVAQTLRTPINKCFFKAKDTVNKTKGSLLVGKDLHQLYIRQRTDLQNI